MADDKLVLVSYKAVLHRVDQIGGAEFANSQDRTSNGVESFNAALRRRVRVSHRNLPVHVFIFLQHVTYWFLAPELSSAD